jgi:hypothetical protein
VKISSGARSREEWNSTYPQWLASLSHYRIARLQGKSYGKSMNLWMEHSFRESSRRGLALG